MTNNRKAIAMFAILICILTWLIDYFEIVYACPYCRTQRTVIGVLGAILLLAKAQHWATRLFSVQVAFFGFVVGALQHFRGWAKIWSGEFKLNATIWTDPTILSALAMLFITVLLILILQNE